MSYDQGGKARHVVRLQLVSPVSAAMDKLLAIKEGRGSALLEPEGAEEAEVHRVNSLQSPGRSSKGSDHAGQAAEAVAGNANPAQASKRWVGCCQVD